MPCLLAVIAFFAPRFVIALVFLFSNFFSRAYTGMIWPLLGFFFMPFTTLAYAAAINWHGAVEGTSFFFVLIAALMDLGVIGGGGRRLLRP